MKIYQFLNFLKFFKINLKKRVFKMNNNNNKMKEF